MLSVNLCSYKCPSVTVTVTAAWFMRHLEESEELRVKRPTAQNSTVPRCAFIKTMTPKGPFTRWVNALFCWTGSNLCARVTSFLPQPETSILNLQIMFPLGVSPPDRLGTVYVERGVWAREMVKVLHFAHQNDSVLTPTLRGCQCCSTGLC